VVVGVSGGADSVCLLRALASLNSDLAHNLIVAHYDHRCRPESADDAGFVASLAASLNLKFQRGNSPASGKDRSEAELRDERYQFLESVAASKGARYVAAGHTRNDDVETIFHNILRGTGGNGLRGIAPFRPLGRDIVLARPMLGVRRSAIEAALQEWDQPYRDDPSNDESRYTRNWLRGKILPSVRTQFPEVDTALLRLGNNVAELQDAVDGWAAQRERACVVYQRNKVTVRVRAEEALPIAVAVGMLQRIWDHQQWGRGEMRHDHWQRVGSLLCDRTPAPACHRFHLPGKILIDASRLPDELLLTKER